MTTMVTGIVPIGTDAGVVLTNQDGVFPAGHVLTGIGNEDTFSVTEHVVPSGSGPTVTGAMVLSVSG
jgi:hypothetical protein